MAGTLKVKIEEEIILNNQDYSSKKTFEIGSIDQVYRRIVTVPADATTTIIDFDAAVSSASGALDVDDVRYLRITNLDSSNNINVGLIGVSDSAQFVVPAGQSLVFGNTASFMLGETDTSPAFTSFESLSHIRVDTDSNTVNVELYVASV